MTLSIQTLGPRRVAAVVSRSPSIDFAGTWGAFREALAAQDLYAPGMSLGSFFKTASLSPESPPSMEWYAAGLLVEDSQTSGAPLETLQIDGGRYVVQTYSGGYDGMGNAWGSFVRALLAAGHRPDLARACFELYLESPELPVNTEKRTNLHVPIVD